MDALLALVLPASAGRESQLNLALDNMAAHGRPQQAYESENLYLGTLSRDTWGSFLLKRGPKVLAIAGRPDWTLHQQDTSAERLERWAERALELAWDAHPRALSELDGDFSLISMDHKQNSLLAAVDPLGRKTLAFRMFPDGLAVASQASALASMLPAAPPSLSALGLWICNEYPGHWSMFEGVAYLPPGFRLHKGASAAPRLEPYWHWRSACPRMGTTQPKQLRRLLEQAVAARIRPGSAVPSSHLSGGMDSSSIAALSGAIGHPPDTYTYAFPSAPGADEWLEASQTARHLGLAPSPIGGPGLWLFKGLENPPIRLEENPFFGWDAFDQELFQTMAGRGSNLLLTGQFGDNLFSGERLPALLVDRVFHGQGSALAQMLQHNRRRGLPVFQGLYRQILSPFLPAWLRQAAAAAWRKTPQRPAFLPRTRYRRLGLQRQIKRIGPLWGNASQRAAQAMMIHQTGGIRRAIHWYERCAAPFGIRVEHPFFDARLVLFMLQLPAGEAFPRDLPKGILRQAMADLLPQSTLQRLEKPDLADVYLEGMRREQDHFEELFSNGSRLATLGLLDSRLARQALKRHLLNPLAHSNRFLFAALAERWLRSRGQAPFSSERLKM